MEINVVDGDIAGVKVDVLITTINSRRRWGGGIDRVIFRCAGDQFHMQAAERLAADPNVQTIVAPKLEQHAAQFRDVVFVIDDLDTQLYGVVLRGLSAADDAGYETVSMPAMRLGMLRDYLATPEEKIDSIALALRAYALHAESLQSVTVVFYDDEELSQMLRDKLA